ncbi:MAG: hypothetical protein PHF56_22495 [Desulfuromonadaceae bacterium]|nr:hypothetical protein [Desulfuromonadaceae bacterium]
MNSSYVRQDATASTSGTIYHLCVAVARCYEMRRGQKLLIEELGDVTVEDIEQIEVKQYSDDLTDGHHNFWNTLHNWTDDAFYDDAYTSLILHTTQNFGAKARLREWNDASINRRLEIITEIHTEFEEAFTAKYAKDVSRKPSSVLIHQRYVMDTSRKACLQRVVPKVWIEARQPTLTELYSKLKETRTQQILECKQNDFLDALIGFVCLPGKKAGERWEITYDAWSTKVQDLSSTYCKETRRFPRKYYKGVIPDPLDIQHRDDLFVQKIHDINYETQVSKAVFDYESTVKTINEEFSAYQVDPELTKVYALTVENRFSLEHSTACYECTDEIRDSHKLYNKVTGSEPPRFSGFDDVADEFRNGILHISMDDAEKQMKWKVRKK